MLTPKWPLEALKAKKVGYKEEMLTKNLASLQQAENADKLAHDDSRILQHSERHVALEIWTKSSNISLSSYVYLKHINSSEILSSLFC